MKHIFLINPGAGQGKAGELIPEIEAVCGTAGIDYEIHETRKGKEAERFVRGRCESFRKDLEKDDQVGTDTEGDECPGRLRFYACGGDGTLNEVVNGAAGYDFAEVGCIPAGTGNDFIRNFPEGRFTDLIAQIRSEARLCDLIHYEGECDGTQVSRYCVNMFNIGFDCNVVDLTDRMKRLPLINGTLAYLTSVAALLIEKKGADLRVEYAPEASGYVYDGKLLLIAVANGCFCGGGIKGISRAVTDDGFFDVSLVRNVPRSTFIKLFPKYMKGTHLEDPRLEDVIRYTHEKTLLISPNERKGKHASSPVMKLCVDGEITEAGPVRFTICPRAFRFVVPKRV